MTGDLDDDDRLAVGWALNGDAPVGRAVREARLRGPQAVLDALTEGGALAPIRAAWEAAGRPAPEGRHTHRTTVEFADGSTVMGVSYLGPDPYEREAVPAFALYLDDRWGPPWPHEHVDWPDFGVPDAHALGVALDRLRERARAGDTVEVGCLGGHGRTGTALACLAGLAGTRAADSVAWVRERYCPHAVETPAQEAFVATFLGLDR